MEGKAVSEVQAVTLTMDVREAVRFLEDPERAQNDVRGMLKLHGVEVAEISERAGKSSRKPHRATSTGKLNCTRCGKPFTSPRGLSMHVTKMHPETRGKD